MAVMDTQIALSRPRGTIELELEEVSADGVLQRTTRELDNVVTYAFRNEMSKWLAGQSSILPGFLAIGAGQEAASVNQKTVTEMVDEFFRKDLATSPQVLSDGTRYRAVFGAAEIAGDIEEVMLFSADAVVVILDALDAITGWSTGAGQTLSVETSDRMQGTGSLESASSGAGPADLTFKKTTLSADISLADTALQVWFYVDDKTKLSGNIAIQLSSSITTGQHQWAWTVAASGLVNGWNYFDLDLTAATITGSPDKTAIVRFELSVTKTHPVTVRIDNLRTFKPAGTGLARAELTPAFTKQIGSVLNITWTIRPDYESKINTFLWEGDDDQAVSADVTAQLAETGAGTFPAVTSHPWTYTSMWLPAASGYMTGGLLALDSQAGCIAVWARFGAVEPSNGALVFDWRQDGSNTISLYWDSASNLWTAVYTRSGVTVTRTAGDTPTNNDYAFLVVGWDVNGLGLSLNGAAMSKVAIATLISAITAQPTWGGGSGLVTTNAKLGPALAFSRVLSDAEIAALYALGRFYVYGED